MSKSIDKAIKRGERIGKAMRKALKISKSSDAADLSRFMDQIQYSKGPGCAVNPWETIFKAEPVQRIVIDDAWVDDIIQINQREQDQQDIGDGLSVFFKDTIQTLYPHFSMSDVDRLQDMFRKAIIRGVSSPPEVFLASTSETKADAASGGDPKGIKADGGGVKNDAAKPDLSLCPKPALDAMARALGYGAVKYSRNNYRAGFKRTRLIAAALRHLTAYSSGEDLDPESGLSHLDHTIATLAMLITNIQEGKSDDDR